MMRFGWALLLGVLALAGCDASNAVVGLSCARGYTQCGNRCVDLLNNNTHCGGCGKTCGADNVCFRAQCTPAATSDAAVSPDASEAPPDGGMGTGMSCPAPQKRCGDDSCHDLGVDVNNCGSCGVVCGGTAPACSNGTCGTTACTSNQALCGGICRNILVDATACGPSCVACAGSNPICVNGTCDNACDAGKQKCSDNVCYDTTIDPRHCGASCVNCAPGFVCSNSACSLVCSGAGLTKCQVTDTFCTDLYNDPQNCGACGVSCASGLCAFNAMTGTGACADQTQTNVVLIGHDYEVTVPAMQQVLVNAVFLSSVSPAKVLEYRGTVSTASRTAVVATLNGSGRAWVGTVVTAANVTQALRNYNVFLIYAQHGSTDAELRALGAQWGTAMEDFSAKGGVIVVMDTNAATNAGTYQIPEAAGMLSFNAPPVLTNVSNQTVSKDPALAASGNAILVNVTNKYFGGAHTVSFSTSQTNQVIRVGDVDTGPLGNPVVIHRIYLP